MEEIRRAHAHLPIMSQLAKELTASLDTLHSKAPLLEALPNAVTTESAAPTATSTMLAHVQSIA